MMIETMELVRVDVQNAIQIFTGGGLNAVLDEIETKVRAIPLDPATPEGRDEIRSVAYRVVRSKTLLDSEGKRLTEEWRKNTALVNAERKRAIERLDALAEEIRKPLTDFENRDKIRIAGHTQALAELQQVLDKLQGGVFSGFPVAVLETDLEDFSELHSQREWEEFTARAADIRAAVVVGLNRLIETRKKFDSDQAELARLRAAETERLQRERDEKLKSEAAEKARLAAERKAKEAADAEARRVIEAAEAERKRVEAEAERVRLRHEEERKAAEAKRAEEERARLAAEKRAEDAEAARLAAELKAETDRKAALEKSEEDAEFAAKREREKIAAEQKAAEVARLKRESDAKLKTKIRSEIFQDFLGFGGPMPEEALDAIMGGKIRHIKVVF